LFDKCSKTSDVNFLLHELNNAKNNENEDIVIESATQSSNIIYSYVLCSDIIDYFHKNIIDHKVNIFHEFLLNNFIDRLIILSITLVHEK
jgi:hypothetical protein